MNLTVKRCLMGLAVSAAMFGIARGQEDQPVGAVQLGPQAVPAPGSDTLQAPPPPSSVVYPPNTGMVDMTPPSGGYGNYFRVTQVDQIMQPRFNIDSRGGGLYGYNAGYSNIGMFVPYQLEENAILWASGQGLITYDGRGGGTVGTGWRYYNPTLDRIIGLAGFVDFDNGHAQPYQQVGFSFESLGRYIDYRANGYVPISNPDHVLVSNLTQTAALVGNGIGLLRNNVVEQAYSGFDAEMGGPTPILGRYGLNAYVGGYYFAGNGVRGGNFTGVSARLLSQVNEDVSFGVQVTDDHVFGLNTQFQVFVNLPSGKSSRWLRNLRVQDRLVQNVFRQNRVIARTEAFNSFDTAINPATHQAYFVANINPNLTTNGNGSVDSPFNSIAAYEALSLSQRQRYDMILVQPRSDATTTNLDTTTTLELFNGQRLLSTSIAHSFTTDNFPGVTMTVPALTGGTSPMLFNSTGGDVITFASGTTRPIEVSGFEIIGSATGNGIVGNSNIGVNINNNNIHNALNGVLLTNLSGTFAAGTGAIFNGNNIHDNVGTGVTVSNHGAPPFVPPLEVAVQNNTFANNGGDGLRLNAEAGSTISGIIGGINTPATATTPAIILSNTFSGNGANGLELDANGGTLNFLTTVAPPANTPIFGIVNNTFTTNGNDGLHIQTTNNSIGTFDIIANTFGSSTSTSQGNKVFGINLVSDSGTNLINIGGATADLGNSFFNDIGGAINFNLTGTNLTTTNIQNNTIIVNATSGGNVILPGFDQNTLAANDDGSTGLVPIGFTADFFGVNFNQVFVNNNGNITLTQPLATFTPFPIVSNGLPMIAPFFADVDTRSGNLVSYGTGTVNGHLAFGVNWPDVRHFSALGGGGLPTNNFQLVLVDRSDVGQGDFDFEFNYKQIQWEAGQASGSNAQGLGGSSARVGYTNGAGNSFEFAGSAVNGALLDSGPAATSLVQNSLNSNLLGQYIFHVRGGIVTNGTIGTQDGISLNVSDSAHLTNSTITNNTAHGLNGFGLQITTNGNAIVDNVLVNNNDFSQNGGGISLNRNDNSVLQVIVANNLLNNNTFSGFEIHASGAATNPMTINLADQDLENEGENGMVIETSGAAILTVNSTRGKFNSNTGDNIHVVTGGTSVLNLNLANTISTNSQNGLSATTNDDSTLNLLITSPADPLFTGAPQSTFSSNSANGILLTSNDRSFMHANVYNTLLEANGTNGIEFDRNAASFIRSSIVDTNMSTNGVNGFFFHGLGSDPQDPNQQQSGSPNKIIMLRDTLDFNGTAGVGQGARFDMFGDSELVFDANATSFSNNAQNGIRIKLTPAAEFGYEVGNERSILDNVKIDNNGSNGIFLTSDITPTQSAALNNNLPFDAPSVTFMQISANTGNTSISNNGFATGATGQSGILMQYMGGNHDILITGDENPTAPTFSTVIQSNKLDGILSQTSLEGDVTLTLDKVVVGGPLASQGNGADGIAFETQASLTIVDGANTLTRNFNGSGIGTLNVSNSLIQNNVGNGINLIGNDFTVNDGGVGNSGVDVPGLLNATITNSDIINNGKNGVSILLQGQMGDFRQPQFFPGNLSTFTIQGNNISSNGLVGVRMEQNAGEQQPFQIWLFQDPQPTNPPFEFNQANFIPFAPNIFNSAENAPVPDAIFFSNWMDLSTVNNARLNLYNNTIQFNGSQGEIVNGVAAPGIGSDGVFIRVGTNAYLAADVQSNVISGNVSNDLHIESFVAYNPNTGVAFEPDPARTIAVAAPGFDRVELDHTAQLDLNLVNNVGNTINIQSPLVNFGQFPFRVPLPGNSTPNGAVLGGLVTGSGDGLKTNVLFGNSGFVNPPARIVQLFQVNNAAGLNTSNSFTQNGFTQDLVNGPEGFFQADWNLRSTNGPFPDPGFPFNVFDSPGNPFSP